MRNPSRVAVTFAVALGLLVVGCGDDDESTSLPTSTTGSTSTTSTSTPSAADFEVFLLPEEPGDDCSEVVGVPRSATVEGEVADALTQLLAGPTPQEEAEGLSSWFSSETAGMLQSVMIEDGAAEVDFEPFAELMPNASTSCGSASLLAQLDRTVLQFPFVERVVYSFDGDRAAFYEWLQLEAPDS